MVSKTLRDTLGDVPGVRILAPQSGPDEDFSAFNTTQESTACDAKTVDGSEFTVCDVPVLEETGFTHFLDGAQKSWLAVYEGFMPIYISHTSAANLKREDREIEAPNDSNWRGALEAFVPMESNLRTALEELLPVVPVDLEDALTGVGAQEKIRDAISKRRDLWERELGQLHEEGILLVDGGVGNILKRHGPQPLVVGLVKSHRKQYFKSRERVELILGMQQGQRSSVFLRESDSNQGLEVFSFYLKLRASDTEGPLHGLVRIELPPQEELIAKVDEIAAWVLYERAPLSLPDGRYDRLLYPIRLVERHLKARQPSNAAIHAIIGY